MGATAMNGACYSLGRTRNLEGSEHLQRPTEGTAAFSGLIPSGTPWEHPTLVCCTNKGGGPAAAEQYNLMSVDTTSLGS